MELVLDEYKPKVAMFAFVGSPLHWHQFYVNSVGGMANVRWPTYLMELKKRFASADFADPLFDLVRLRHTGYTRPPPPKSTLPAILTGSKPNYTTSTTNNSTKANTTTNSSTTPNGNFKKPTPAEIADKKRKGLCFWCQTKYNPGHKCLGAQVYSMVISDEDESMNSGYRVEEIPDIGEFSELDPEISETEVQSIISLHAIYGTSGYQTMRISCTVKHHSLVLLVDSGSTHNFVDGNVVKSLG
ncbi:hypothetical protein COLO4_33758 [Corchorus olitorius]|uniref:Retrotransposon gag protein n=1 Tax=Corchorus olitorius TaxID=93759 RepID=A0A1R3GRL4_9ROSI|nr:hypothetical protein COLO4_33758 [Corchorus olitorius]